MKTRPMAFPSEPSAEPSRRELSPAEKAGLIEAEEDMRAGRVIPFEEVQAWVESWDTPAELPPPHNRWR